MPRAEFAHCYGYHWQTFDRPETLKRDCYECVRCGMPDRPMGLRSALDVAHLDGDPTNPDPDNLATLCRRDHRAHDYDAWAALYAEYVRHRREERLDAKDAERPLLAMLQEAS